MKNLSKKTVIIAVAIVLAVAILVTSLALVFGGGDFRRAKWGMTLEQVRSRESAQLVTDESSRLGYKISKFEGVNVDTIFFYNFDKTDGKLWQVSTGYTVDGYKDKTAVKLINAFEKKYGEPDEYEESAVSYIHTWQEDGTEIVLSQLQTYILITYTDITKTDK